MIDCLYYSSQKIPERCENSFVELRNKLQKALLVNEANHTIFEPSHWLLQIDSSWPVNFLKYWFQELAYLTHSIIKATYWSINIVKWL